MAYLVLSVLCSTCIFVAFKMYHIHRVNTLLAIIVNYVVACTVGLIFYEGSIDLRALAQNAWLPWALALGILFILVFNIMAATSQKLGIGVASVATKMSFVMPVVLGIFLYNEHLGAKDVIGVVIAMFAVYFSSVKGRDTMVGTSVILLPLMVFLGSGVIDSAITYFEAELVPTAQFPLFSAMVFMAAAVSGLLYAQWGSKTSLRRINGKDILGGIALGIPNYFSIFFLLKALGHESYSSGLVFTINNVAIVLLSTLVGLFMFKERLSVRNRLGLALAVCSIILVA